MKKLIAILLSLTIAFALGIPAFASEEAEEIPAAREEEILDIIESEEFKEALEEEGVDVEDFEEKIEDGDYVIVEDEEDLREILTDEEIEEIRKQEALSVFDVVGENAKNGLIGLVMLPFVPVMLIVPVFGWVTSAAALLGPVRIISLPFQFIGACIEAIDIYVNFDYSIYTTTVESLLAL